MESYLLPGIAQRQGHPESWISTSNLEFTVEFPVTLPLLEVQMKLRDPDPGAQLRPLTEQSGLNRKGFFLHCTTC